MIWPLRRKSVIPVIALTGAILPASRTGTGLNATTLEGVIDAAFALKAPAVALEINSPGGSPVQSHLIHDLIRRAARRRSRPVLAFTTDVAASGGYILALAGDEIFAAPDSLLGSIGVVSGGFGFVGALDKLGVERRIYTAGAHKAFLDPFLPEQPDNVARLRAIQASVHARFVDLVRARRGSRLADDPRLFTGDVFAGTEAVALGLADATGTPRAVIDDRFGPEFKLRRFGGPRRRWPLSLLGSALLPGPVAGSGVASPAAWAGAALETVEERAVWARFGL